MLHLNLQSVSVDPVPTSLLEMPHLSSLYLKVRDQRSISAQASQLAFFGVLCFLSVAANGRRKFKEHHGTL